MHTIRIKFSNKIEKRYILNKLSKYNNYRSNILYNDYENFIEVKVKNLYDLLLFFSNAKNRAFYLNNDNNNLMLEIY